MEYAIVKHKSYVIKNLYKKRKHLTVENGLLYKQITRNGLCNKQLVINNSCIEILIEVYHANQAHLGHDRTI